MNKNLSSEVDFAFLDSGIGGIPYLNALKEAFPNANCVYVGDTANFPYGEKSPAEIIEKATNITRTIIDRWHPKALIIACNTISATALADLRETFPDTPFIGTVPAIRLAANVTKNKRIGFLATNATINHSYCKKLIEDSAPDCTIINRGDPNLVAFIEQNLLTTTEAEKLAAVTPAVNFFLEQNCDTIILGCTHFVHLAKEIAEVAGESVKVVDSRDGVIRQAIKATNFKATDSNPSTPQVFTTSLTPDIESTYKALCSHYRLFWDNAISE